MRFNNTLTRRAESPEMFNQWPGFLRIWAIIFGVIAVIPSLPQKNKPAVADWPVRRLVSKLIVLLPAKLRDHPAPRLAGLLACPDNADVDDRRGEAKPHRFLGTSRVT